MNQIYLDYAAATPVDPRVLMAMQPYFTERFYNPSASYESAHAIARDFQAARASVAHHLGARPAEIVFTAGGSEANNLAVHGVMRQFTAGNVVVSAAEHESVLLAARQYDCHEVSLTPQGFVDLAALERVIDNHTALVSIMYANNEIGTIQPIREIAAVIARKRGQRTAQSCPLYFHSDAAQAANYLDLHVARMGVDFLSLNGGKIYGPKQSGALYVRAGSKLLPLIYGGGQEGGLRSGTENVATAIGLAKALEIAQGERHSETKRLQALQRHFLGLIAAQLPQAHVNGSLRKRLPNNVHLTLPGSDNERLIIQLDQAGIMAAAGSACSAGREEASHVLQALGLSELSARASLRFSMGRLSDEAAIDYTVRTLAGLLAG